jgi:Na+-transporting methylmalonyl-CoA/oxaloacetate decarboxylase gamma subunit
MGETLDYALQITAIGMTLVFGAIVLLWGLIALIVRLAPENGNVPDAVESVSAAPSAGDADSIPDSASDARRRQAAAAAVAVALARQAATHARIPAQHPRRILNPISPWQAAQRATQLNQKGPRR